MSGKGSAPRPFSVPKESFDESFERIFGKKKEPAKSGSNHLEEKKDDAETDSVGGTEL